MKKLNGSLITRRKLVLIFSILSILSAPMSWAGWGAIACQDKNPEACSWVSGRWSYSSAVSQAIDRCEARHGSHCKLMRWEHNRCASGPRGILVCR